MQLLSIGVLAASLGLVACAEPETGTFNEHFDNGYVRFVDSMSAPGNQWHLRGRVDLSVRGEWIRVVNNGVVYVIPRDRVVYAGAAEMRLDEPPPRGPSERAPPPAAPPPAAPPPAAAP